MPDFSAKLLQQLVAQELAKPQSAYEQPIQEAPKQGVSKWAQLATAGGHAADAASTIYALSGDGEEANPIYGDNPSAMKIAGIKGGTAALQMLMQHVLGKNHPKIANAMGFGTGAALGAVSASNISKAKK